MPTPAKLTDSELKNIQSTIYSPKQRRVLAFLAKNPRSTTPEIIRKCEVISFPNLKYLICGNLRGFNLVVDGEWVNRRNSFGEKMKVKLWALYRI